MKKRPFKIGNLGQTSLEYLLLIVVSSGIGLTFFKKAEDFLLKNPNSLIGKHIRGLEQQLSSDPKFKTFNFIR